MIKRFSILLALLFVCTQVSANPTSEDINAMPVVGQAKLRVAFWNIYEARLRAPAGRYSPEQTHALVLTYLRDFSKKNLIKETKKQLEHIGLGDHANIDTWLTRLDELWVDVEENESITLYVDQSKHAHFFHNHHWLGKIADPEFSAAFAGIWLSERSSEPKLREQLIGEKP